ncbi:MAG: ribonuclease HII [Actinomycetota bacterium]|jgi:ribonuclease HII
MAVATDLERYEAALRAQGFGRIAGADEAGRGALAGPLVAAAVIIPEGFETAGIRDSKQLTARQRDRQFERIVAGCVVAVAKAPPSTLDSRGLHRSNIALLRRAVRALDPEPDYALLDGFPVPRMPCPALAVKKGDAVSACVAAASIVAKVTRDRIMIRLDRRYPAFGFSQNKGYGTRDHWVALEAHGPSAVHRLSFAGVGQPSLPGLGRADVGPA